MRAQNYFTPALVVAALLLGQSCSRTSTQSKFATPGDAAKALMQALKTDNTEQIAAIFGRDALEAVASGDAVSDKQDRAVVSLAMEQSWRWAPLGPDRQELIVGDEQWPFPVPLAKSGDQWAFDSEAGKREVLARRIGRNELGVIDLCQAYVDLQKEYAADPHDGKPAGLYAQRLRSTPGHQDGLYWETNPGEKPSPLGDLAAHAADEGYAQNRTEGSPFRGYRYRILTAQGASAPGGQKSYVVNGDMPGGFAFVAYPATYGSSGVMTFVVNQDGSVYQKDLGRDTSSLAAKITEYNPDGSWEPVKTAVTLPSGALSLSAVLQAVESTGYAPVVEVEFEKDHWKIKAYRGGQLLQLKADVFKGEVLPNPPPTLEKPLSAVIKVLEDQGYGPILDVERAEGSEGGAAWEVEAYKGKSEVTVGVEPSSGKITTK